MSTVCVHGLGYIGVPTAAVLATAGHEVAGYDTDPAVRDRIRRGEVDLDEPRLETLVASALDSERLTVAEDAPAAAYHVICVPTPLDRSSKDADLEYVRAAGRTIATRLRPGDTVILESTVPPGTTTTELAPILEGSGHSSGTEFGLAHSPETVLPGNVVAELRANDRIVGGVDRDSVESARRLYESFVSGSIRTVEDPTVAEFVKLIQNTSRDVEIALANEIAKIARDYDVDSREAIGLANSHPRVDILDPGPGVGGHCLPIDPWFLGQDSDRLDLVATARRVNDGMSGYVVDLLEATLGDLADRKVAILGVAYKGNVSDTRNSPGLRLARELQHVRDDVRRVTADGGTVDAPEVALHDPHVTDQTLALTDLPSAATGADALVVATDHDEFAAIDPRPCYDRMAGTTVIDTKAVLNRQQWQDIGFDVRRI